MKRVIPIGAINKVTGEYVYLKMANKKNKYICPDCNKDLILCQGKIRAHHFRHKVDSVNPCYRYSNPTEAQIHKDAKLLLKSLLERKIQISFIRNCCCCEKNEEFEILEVSETSVIKIEYRFDYNGTKIADVAYIDDGELLCIFEIYNTHKTRDVKRPEPWFEIDAEKLIEMANDNTLSTSLQIPCIRYEKCESCIEKEEAAIRNKKAAAKILVEWIHNKEGAIEPLYFRDYHGFIDLMNDSETEFEVGNVRPDIVLIDKYNERYYIFLDKPSFTPKQIQQEYLDNGVALYFIDVDWILEQKHAPTKLKYSLLYNDDYTDHNEKKNARYLIRELNTEDFVYLNVEFSHKDFIKNIGGKWNSKHKLWYVSHDICDIYFRRLRMYVIFWKALGIFY